MNDQERQKAVMRVRRETKLDVRRSFDGIRINLGSQPLYHLQVYMAYFRGLANISQYGNGKYKSTNLYDVADLESGEGYLDNVYLVFDDFFEGQDIDGE